MYYPIAIEPGDDKHAFGVVVPDLPGCFSAGYSLVDAMAQARDAILLHLEGRNHLSDAVERVNITIPKCVLTAADRLAAARGETRSGFRARAALETMARD